jgi:hypothetical protein
MEAKLDIAKGFPEELYRERYAKAKSVQICMRCGEPVPDLDTDSARLEYRISALCEACRNQIIYSCLHKTREPETSCKIG